MAISQPSAVDTATFEAIQACSSTLPTLSYERMFPGTTDYRVDQCSDHNGLQNLVGEMVLRFRSAYRTVRC